MKVPEGVKIEVANGVITVTGPKGKAARNYDSARVDVKLQGGEIAVTQIAKKINRATSALSHSVEAHVKNLFEGVTKGFTKKLTIVFSHFPVTVEVKGNEVFVKNFMGEKSARRAKIVTGATVQAGKTEITVTGLDREAVGQTAANIISATKLTKRDRRVFQDGIYHALEQ